MALTLWKARPDQLAFGVVPAYRRYELYQARYHELVPVVAAQMSGLAAGALEVLDIGAGEGSAKRFVDALAGPARWTAVEIDPGRAGRLRDLGYERVLSDVDLERDRLPFEAGRFDVVIASHVLEHLGDAPVALADWMRVLRPGGSLLLGVPMHPRWLSALATWRFRLIGRKPRGHCHFFSWASLGALLRGYQVRRVWGFRFFSARRQLPLEDWEWFYRWSRWVGGRFPWLCGEVNAHLVKPLASAGLRDRLPSNGV